METVEDDVFVVFDFAVPIFAGGQIVETTGNDVEVKVRDGLSGGSTVLNGPIETIGLEDRHQNSGHLAG